MNYISGTAHDMMALIEIEEELKKHLEPAKQKAEQRIDELSTIVREISPSNINQSNLINNSVPSKIPEILISLITVKAHGLSELPSHFQ